MKQILFLVLSMIGVTLGLDLFDLKQGVRSKFGLGLGRGSKYYFDIPLYASEATSQGWTKTNRPEGPLPSLDLYCAPELSFCGLYDDTGFIAGTQVAVQKNKFSNASLDWTVQGYKTWTVNGVEFWAIQQYFVNEVDLPSYACGSEGDVPPRGEGPAAAGGGARALPRFLSTLSFPISCAVHFSIVCDENK
ncbi:hypothetical protein O0L34_g662 [Tuta absoluta]|nr:hypothetical protein O0L34_g662 [Tuta absoluta]